MHVVKARTRLLVMVVLVCSGCLSYALRVAPKPLTAPPLALYGAAPGTTTAKALSERGWALADDVGDRRTFVLGEPEAGVREAEAHGRVDAIGTLTIEFVRVRYQNPRLTTYRTLLDGLVRLHGAPQVSDERPSFAPLDLSDPRNERPRPSRVVVHRWHGEKADLVLAGGLEAEENLRTAMEYQLLLVPPEPVLPQAP